MSEENPDIDSALFTQVIVFGKFGDVNSDGTVDTTFLRNWIFYIPIPT